MATKTHKRHRTALETKEAFVNLLEQEGASAIGEFVSRTKPVECRCKTGHVWFRSCVM